MRWAVLLALCASILLAPRAYAAQRYHVVAEGHTLGKIAKRYNVTIAELCEANHISRRDRLKPGQKLLIPDPKAPAASRAPEKAKDAAPEPRTDGRKIHVVASGHTLIDIANRYGVSVEAICNANGITRDTPIYPDQELTIPDKNAPDAPYTEPEAAEPPPAPPEPKSNNGLQVLTVPGAPPAYYYEPTGKGRKTLRPVIMYLHGRGGNPQHDCRRWARVARHLGWVVCPSGPADRGGGARGWNNNWAAGQLIVKRTLDALRAKYGRRVQLYGNTIVGFSEGALVAMNVGVREARAFNRWLILAADSDYWGGAGVEALEKRRALVRRVYLITGQKDGVSNGTDTVRRWLAKAGVPTRISVPADMGHELALERKAGLYRSALVWLQKGGPRGQSGDGKLAVLAPPPDAP